MNKKKSVKNSVYVMLFVLIAVLFLTAFLPAIYAYFTATANEKGNIQFGSIGINLIGGDGEILSASSLKTKYLDDIMPGSTINLNDITVENSGTSDEYVLINVDVSIAKTGATTLTYNNWYNVEGIQVNVNDFAINSAEATLIEKGSSQTSNIAWTFPGNALSNDYQGATATVTVGAYGVQTLLPDAEAYVSKPLYASYFICKKAIEMPNKNLFSIKNAEAYQQSLVDSGLALASVDIIEYDGKTCLSAQATSLYLSGTWYYFPINCKENTQYTISYSALLSEIRTDKDASEIITGLRFYYSDGSANWLNSVKNVETWQNFTFTSQSGKTVVGVGLQYDYNNRVYYTDIMLEEGTTATEFVPHNADQPHTEITTDPLRKVGSVSDGYRVSTQMVTRNVGKIEFTGNENWVKTAISGQVNTTRYTVVPLDSNFKMGTLAEASYNSHFEKYVEHSEDEVGYLESGDNTNYSIKSNILDDVEAFKAWLASEYEAGHPVTVWYQLETATKQTAFPSKNLYEASQFLHYETGATNNCESSGAVTITKKDDPGRENKDLTATTPELGGDLFNYLYDKPITISCKIKRYSDDVVTAPRISVNYKPISGTDVGRTLNFLNNIPNNGKWQYIWVTIPAISSYAESASVNRIVIWLADHSSSTNRHFEVKDIQIEVGSSPTDFEDYDPTVYAYARGVALRQVGTVKDEYNATSGTISKYIVKYKTKSTTFGIAYWKDSVTENSMGIFLISTDILGDYGNQKIQKDIYSSHFKVNTGAAYNTKNDSIVGTCGCYPTSSPPYIGLKVPFTNLEAFENWLDSEWANGTPVTFWLALITPETVTV